MSRASRGNACNELLTNTNDGWIPVFHPQVIKDNDVRDDTPHGRQAASSNWLMYPLWARVQLSAILYIGGLLLASVGIHRPPIINFTCVARLPSLRTPSSRVPSQVNTQALYRAAMPDLRPLLVSSLWSRVTHFSAASSTARSWSKKQQPCHVSTAPETGRSVSTTGSAPGERVEAMQSISHVGATGATKNVVERQKPVCVTNRGSVTDVETTTFGHVLLLYGFD
ncbi:hypothetical protein FDECE_3356 [Fusarium decemcellulare]|nr:hypothetical protein FDECE_3356 [Fusarium decemcellulare]